MVDRSIVLRLRAEISDFKRQMDEASKATEKVGKSGEETAKRADTALGRMVQSATQNQEAWRTAGATLTAFGAVTTAALGATVVAAMRWESAWTGVLKTVDGTPAELARVEEGLRGLAQVLPASHEQIAAVAEAAGQLGVQAANVVDFTKVMIDLGETTNLSAEEAATSLARFSNIMGTSQKDVHRLGAALVGLGNNYATTESEILSMSMRLAGAGRQAGLSEGQVLGLAAAMSSVGIEAEAGGTAMSLTMKRVGKAVDEGGEALDTFARIAGMSSQDFQQAWREDAASALTAFVQGLDRVQQSGGSVNAVLEELGITGIRESDALLRLSAAGTLAFDAMTQGVTEYADATALIDEANKRYETTEAKLQIARNAINDAAIDIGGTFLPVLAQGAEALAGFAKWFADLPGPVQTTLTGLTGVTGVVSLLAGGLLLTIPRLIETVKAFRTLSTIAPSVSTRLGAVGRGAQRAAVGIAALAATSPAFNAWADAIVKPSGAAKDALQAFTGEAAQAAVSAETLNNAFTDIIAPTDEVGEFGAAVRLAFDPGFMGRFNQVVTGATAVLSLGLVQPTSGVDELKNRFQELGRTLAMLDSTSATATFREMAAATDGTEESLAGLLDLMPDYKNALVTTATESGLATDTATLLQIALGEIGPAATSAGDGAAYLTDGLEDLDPAAQAAADALAEWMQLVADSDASFVDLLGGYDSVIEKNRALAQETADATEDASDSWEDFYDGHTVALADYLAQLEEQVAAQQAWETNMLLLSGRVSQGVLDELARLGPEGAPLVADLVDASDEELARLESVYGQRADDATNAFAANLDAAGPVLAWIMENHGAEAADAAAAALASGERDIQGVLDQYGLKFDVDADTGAAQVAMDSFVLNNRGRSITVKVQTQNSGTTYRVAGTNIRFTDEDGGLHVGRRRVFEDGGYGADGRYYARAPQIVPGGADILWGEKATGWEAYISGKPSQRERNVNIWREAGRRLDAFADGGMVASRYTAPALSPVVSVAAPSSGGAVELSAGSARMVAGYLAEALRGAPLTVGVRELSGALRGSDRSLR